MLATLRGGMAFENAQGVPYLSASDGAQRWWRWRRRRRRRAVAGDKLSRAGGGREGGGGKADVLSGGVGEATDRKGMPRLLAILDSCDGEGGEDGDEKEGL
eukprot:72545-Hanusia_phi.AAC.1